MQETLQRLSRLYSAVYLLLYDCIHMKLIQLMKREQEVTDGSVWREKLEGRNGLTIILKVKEIQKKQ